MNYQTIMTVSLGEFTQRQHRYERGRGREGERSIKCSAYVLTQRIVSELGLAYEGADLQTKGPPPCQLGPRKISVENTWKQTRVLEVKPSKGSESSPVRPALSQRQYVASSLFVYFNVEIQIRNILQARLFL